MVRKAAKTNYLLYGIIALVITGIVIAALVFGGDEAKHTSKKSASTAQNSACGPYRNDRSITINGAAFKTEIAKSQAEFAKGLSGRPCILADQAMLFAFTQEGQYRFWMKDMKFPIDIIWINSADRVAAMEIDVDPSTYHSKSPFFENDTKHLAKFVLEIKANRSKELGMVLGTPVIF